MSCTLGQIICSTAISTKETGTEAGVDGNTVEVHAGVEREVVEARDGEEGEGGEAIDGVEEEDVEAIDGVEDRYATVGLSGGLERLSATTFFSPCTCLRSVVNSAIKARCLCCLADHGGETL